jgi:hypothetical protein
MNTLHKFIPILLSTEMVQAYLAGRKNQTRRTRGLDMINESPDDWKFICLGPHPEKPNDRRLFAYFRTTFGTTWTYIPCPYGIPGDTIWWRETWVELQGAPDIQDGTTDTGLFIYKADPVKVGVWYGKWKPSIFMPFNAARLFSENTGIRMERLHDISEEDAIGEGIIGVDRAGGYGYGLSKEWNYKIPIHEQTPLIAYKRLWEYINGSDSWKKNPWVWVIEFKQIDKPII